MLSVAVICVCLNAAETIRQTIDSVARAGDRVDRFVIVDGGSTDGTLDVIRSAEAAFEGRLTWLSEPDEGLYFAMNRGLGLVDSRYVLFLGADDVLVDGALEKAAEMAGGDVDADLLFGDVRVIATDGTSHVQQGCEIPKLIGDIPRAMPACHQASLYSVRAMRELGGFDTQFRIAADYDLYLRFRDAGMSAVYVPTVVSEFRLGGVSSRWGIATAREYRRVWVKHGIPRLVAWMRMARSIGNLYAARVLRRVRLP